MMGVFLYIFSSIGFLFIGIYIGKKSKRVDGIFIVNESDPEITRWIIDVDFDPRDLVNKKEVRLKVKKLDKEVV